jgi:hypothetical protein
MKIEIANVQQKYKFFWISFYFWKNKQKQSGAAEACWAHNPEVRRSKLRSARQMFFWWCNVFSKNLFVHSRLEQCRIDGSVVECVKVLEKNLTLNYNEHEMPEAISHM